MKVVVGEYNKDGYIITSANGDVLYEAGANAVDSTAPGRDVSLATLRRWCIKTGKEIAAEIGAIWSGAENVTERQTQAYPSGLNRAGWGGLL